MTDTSPQDWMIERDILGDLPMVAGGLEADSKDKAHVNYKLLSSVQNKVSEVLNSGRKAHENLSIGFSEEGSAEFRGPEGQNALIVFPGTRRGVDDFRYNRAIIYFEQADGLHVLYLQAFSNTGDLPRAWGNEARYGVSAVHSMQTRRGLQEVPIDKPGALLVYSWLLAATAFNKDSVEHTPVVTQDFGRESYIRADLVQAMGGLSIGAEHELYRSSVEYGLEQTGPGESRNLIRVLEEAIRAVEPTR